MTSRTDFIKTSGIAGASSIFPEKLFFQKPDVVRNPSRKDEIARMALASKEH